MTSVGGPREFSGTAHGCAVRPSSWVADEVYWLDLAWVGRGHRTAHAVDDRVVTSGARNPHAEEVVELHTRRLGGLEGLLVEQRGRGLDKHDVAAHPVALEAPDVIGDQEGRVTVLSRAGHPVGLGGRVVGQFVLEEDVGAALAGPDHLGSLVMLHEQAVGGDVVSGDDYAGGALVGGPAHVVAVV